MSYADIMANLKKQYLDDLKKSSEDFFKEVRTTNENDELRNFFHKLKGSGATYGLPDFSEYGKHFEDKVKAGEFTEDDFHTAKERMSELLNKHCD